jgi:hypothetical protein
MTKEKRKIYNKEWRAKHPNYYKIRDNAHKDEKKGYYGENKERYKKGFHLYGLNHTKEQRARNLKKYGLTDEDYNNMFTAQGGKCLICGKHQSELKKALSVDHCHSTGNIRGLLCNNCNVGIGFLLHSPDIIESALNYIKNSQN